MTTDITAKQAAQIDEITVKAIGGIAHKAVSAAIKAMAQMPVRHDNHHAIALLAAALIPVYIEISSTLRKAAHDGKLER